MSTATASRYYKKDIHPHLTIYVEVKSLDDLLITCVYDQSGVTKVFNAFVHWVNATENRIVVVAEKQLDIEIIMLNSLSFSELILIPQTEYLLALGVYEALKKTDV